MDGLPGVDGAKVSLRFMATVHTVEVGSLQTPEPNTFKLSFSQFLTFDPNKNALF